MPLFLITTGNQTVAKTAQVPRKAADLRWPGTSVEIRLNLRPISGEVFQPGKTSLAGLK